MLRFAIAKPSLMQSFVAATRPVGPAAPVPVPADPLADLAGEGQLQALVPASTVIPDDGPASLQIGDRDSAAASAETSDDRMLNSEIQVVAGQISEAQQLGSNLENRVDDAARSLSEAMDAGSSSSGEQSVDLTDVYLVRPVREEAGSDFADTLGASTREALASDVLGDGMPHAIDPVSSDEASPSDLSIPTDAGDRLSADEAIAAIIGSEGRAAIESEVVGDGLFHDAPPSLAQDSVEAADLPEVARPEDETSPVRETPSSDERRLETGHLIADLIDAGGRAAIAEQIAADQAFEAEVQDRFEHGGGVIPVPSHFHINVLFDDSANQAGLEEFRADVLAVAAYLERQYTDDVTMNVHVGYGEINGEAWASDDTAAAHSDTGWQSFSYDEIADALRRDGHTGDDATAVATLPGLDPASGDHTWWLTDAQAAALGLSDTRVVDTFIGFADPAHLGGWAFDFDRSDGIETNHYDFIGTIYHELTENMGRQLGAGQELGTSVPRDYALDLFSYDAPGERAGGRGGYFSFDDGNTNRGNFWGLDQPRQDVDAADWDPSFKDDPNGAAVANTVGYISDTDQRLLDVIGWDRRADDYGSDTDFAGELKMDPLLRHGLSSGDLEHRSDSDWFRVLLNQGTHYLIRIGGAEAADALDDATVALYDRHSNRLVSSAAGHSSLEFTGDADQYYIAVSSASGTHTGHYAVRIDAVPDPYDTGVSAAPAPAAVHDGDGWLPAAPDTAGSLAPVDRDTSLTGLLAIDDMSHQLFV